MTFEQTMHTIESHLKALQADYDRMVTLNKVLEKKAECLESRLNTEMETSARLARKLTTAKEENSQLKEKIKALSDEDTLLAKDMIVFASELAKSLEGKHNA
jgi:archaellum component FlaC